MTPRHAEIRAKVQMAMALNPAIRHEIADHLITAGASLIEAGSTLFGLVCGAPARGDNRDESRAFEIDGDPFPSAIAATHVGDAATLSARN